jgi:hypothetical protein
MVNFSRDPTGFYLLPVRAAHSWTQMALYDSSPQVGLVDGQTTAALTVFTNAPVNRDGLSPL